MKVLIVDDEQVIGDALASRLKSDHLEVTTRTNGRDGLKAFEVWSPDLVVLDIVMPGEFDGLEVCRRIRDVSDVPIMMMSAQAITEADIVEGLMAVGEKLTKRIDPPMPVPFAPSSDSETATSFAVSVTVD